MTDRDLTPQEEEHVRRLLRAARHDEPIPGDVSARLDRVLVDLSAGRAEQAELAASRDEHAPSASAAAHAPGPGARDELAERRRRRRLGAGLLAAAAVVVAGVTLPQIASDLGGSGGSADRSSAEQPMQDAEGKNEDAAEVDSQATASGEAMPTLRTDRPLRPQLRDVRDRLPLVSAPASSACLDQTPPGAVSVSVTLDGEAAAALVHAPSNERQLVELYRCGDPDPVARARFATP